MSDDTQYMLPEERESVSHDTWPGVYPGTVVDVSSDPKQRGHIRVRVDQVYGVASDPPDAKIPDDRLPWAVPCWPFAGADVGCLMVPPVGSGVWVSFWAGDPASPVWLGGWLGSGDAPERWTSAYKGSAGPCTRLVRTPTGHTFEMRWCEGEEEILLETAGGVKARFIDATALGGPKVSVATPGGQKVEMTDTPPRVATETTGDVDVTAAGKTTQTFALASVLAFALGATLTAGGAGLTLALALLTMTVAGPIVVTAAAITLTGAVFLGIVGVKYRLVDERYFTSVQNPNKIVFDGHVHTAPGGGGPTSGPQQGPAGGSPVVFVQGSAPAHTTSATVAN